MTVKITYFVHGTTTDNEKGIATGWNQGELSQKGVTQSIKLRSEIKQKFAAVFCSDLKRAVDSANLTFGKDVPNIIHDRRLRECNYGEFNGATAAQVESMMLSCVITPFPGGESYRDVEKRMLNLLEELSRKYDGRSVAFVAHQAPQLALEVLTKGRTWKEAIDSDWRHIGKWQPGWEYKW